MKSKGRLILLCLPLLVLFNCIARAELDVEEAIFAVKYKSSSIDFLVLFHEYDLFVPFEEVCNFLQIYYNIDKQTGDISGYINSEDNSYDIDLSQGRYKSIDNKRESISENDWIDYGYGKFINIDFFANLFAVDVNKNYNDLSISIISEYDMPIVRSAQIEQLSNKFSKKENDSKNIPVIYSRDYNIINGGMLDYNLAFRNISGNSSYNLNSNLGMEILGGELQYGFIGRAFDDNFQYNEKYRLRYQFSNDYVKSVSFGDIYNINYRGTTTRGYRSDFHNLRGVNITNESFETRGDFNKYVIEDVIDPGWIVELYVNKQLYDIKKSDLNGNYRFEMPISYGNTEILVKYYGTKGEYYEETKSFNIPNEFLKSGNVKYVANLAEDYNSKLKLGDASVSFGIFDWLTSTVNFSKVEASKDYSLVSRSSLNLFNRSMLNVLATNNGIYEMGIKIPKSFLGSIDVIYTNYEMTTDSSYMNTKSSLYFMNSINRLFNLPITVSLFGSRNMSHSINSNQLNSNIIFNLGKLNFRFRHNMSFTEKNFEIRNFAQNLNTDVSLYINELPKPFKFLGRARLNASLNYLPDVNEISDYAFSMEQFITRNTFISFNYSHSVVSNQSHYSLGLNINTSNFRSRSMTNYREGSTANYSSEISGIIEYDSYSHKVNLSNSMGSNTHTGRSAAIVRFFMDNNNNGKFDEDDQIIKEADFSLIRSFARKRDFGDYKIITNLQPGNKYTIQVNNESFSNPSVLPKFTQLAFIADPYSYKMIDIPCHQGGIVEGYVERMKIEESKESQNDINKKDNIKKNTKIENISYSGQGGVKIHIISEDSVFKSSAIAFSDGTYFFTGIPIGKYRAYIDEKQLDILDCYSVPEYHSIEVNAVADGDYIGDLSFKLRPTIIHDPLSAPEKLPAPDILPEASISEVDIISNYKISNYLLDNNSTLILLTYEDNQVINDSIAVMKLDLLCDLLSSNSQFCILVAEYDNRNKSGSLNSEFEEIREHFKSKGINSDRIKKMQFDENLKREYSDLIRNNKIIYILINLCE